MNDNFKKEFKLVLPCLFRRGTDRNVNGNYTQYTHVETNPSVLMNKSPQKNACNDNISDSKAYFESETEKVRLNVNSEMEPSD